MEKGSHFKRARGAGVKGVLGLAVLATAAGVYFSGGAMAESAVRIPPPAASAQPEQGATQTAVFAGGCFWGVQAVFQHTKGVVNAVSGYAGGSPEDAQYDKVSGGETGHAEAVQVTYDPRQVSYGKLLQIYFSVAHDPTQRNAQYPDFGPQYRSAIFYRDASQKQAAEQYIAQLEQAKVFRGKIATQLAPLNAFYPAEAYHQDYATLHPESGYIQRYDAPKLTHLQTLFPEVYRGQPVLVAQQGEKR